MDILLGVFVMVSAGCFCKFCLQLPGQILYRDASLPKHLQHPLPEQQDACFFLRRLWEPITLRTGWQILCQADTWKYLL